MKLQAGKPGHAVRILVLESGSGSGGSITFLRSFLTHIDRDTMEASVALYYPNPSRELDELRDLQFPVMFLAQAPPANSRGISGILKSQLPLAWRVRNVIRRQRIDLVLLNQDMHYHVAGVVGARLAGVPCVCRKAGGIGEGRKIKRLLTPWVDRFVSISRATENDQRRNKATRDLLTIREGVDLARFAAPPCKQEARKRLGIPEGRKVVAAICRVAEGKGLPEFVRMAAQVSHSDPSSLFLIVGDEDSEHHGLLTEIRAQADRLGISDSLILTGWRHDVPAVMAAIDVFVHCPTTFIEGQCLTCLEAMAAGLPVVVSENGGLPDAVVNGVTGFVVPPGDTEMMAEAVLRILGDPALARSFAVRARARVKQMFDIAENAVKLQAVLMQSAGAPCELRASV